MWISFFPGNRQLFILVLCLNFACNKAKESPSERAQPDTEMALADACITASPYPSPGSRSCQDCAKSWIKASVQGPSGEQACAASVKRRAHFISLLDLATTYDEEECQHTVYVERGSPLQLSARQIGDVLSGFLSGGVFAKPVACELVRVHQSEVAESLTLPTCSVLYPSRFDELNLDTSEWGLGTHRFHFAPNQGTPFANIRVVPERPEHWLGVKDESNEDCAADWADAEAAKSYCGEDHFGNQLIAQLEGIETTVAVQLGGSVSGRRCYLEHTWPDGAVDKEHVNCRNEEAEPLLKADRSLEVGRHRFALGSEEKPNSKQVSVLVLPAPPQSYVQVKANGYCGWASNNPEEVAHHLKETCVHPLSYENRELTNAENVLVSFFDGQEVTLELSGYILPDQGEAEECVFVLGGGEIDAGSCANARATVTTTESFHSLVLKRKTAPTHITPSVAVRIFRDCSIGLAEFPTLVARVTNAATNNPPPQENDCPKPDLNVSRAACRHGLAMAYKDEDGYVIQTAPYGNCTAGTCIIGCTVPETTCETFNQAYPLEPRSNTVLASEPVAAPGLEHSCDASGLSTRYVNWMGSFSITSRPDPDDRTQCLATVTFSDGNHDKIEWRAPSARQLLEKIDGTVFRMRPLGGQIYSYDDEPHGFIHACTEAQVTVTKQVDQ